MAKYKMLNGNETKLNDAEETMIDADAKHGMMMHLIEE